MNSELPWRPGRHNGRTVYTRTGGDDWEADTFIGVFDTPALAEAACAAHNQALQSNISSNNTGMSQGSLISGSGSASESAHVKLLPPADADLTGGLGREFRVAANLEHTGLHEVVELVEGQGLVVRIGGLERWQAYAIAAILHPPFEE